MAKPEIHERNILFRVLGQSNSQNGREALANIRSGADFKKKYAIKKKMLYQREYLAKRAF